MKRKLFSLLVLLMTVVTGAWAQETLLVTITAGGTVTYDPATATDVAEITMTGATQLGTWEDYYYGNHYSWLNSSWNDTDKGTLEVTAKPGYTITKVVFSGSDIVGSPGSREVTASPFAVYPWGSGSAFGSAVYTSDSYTEIIKNTASNDILGIDKIEVYGYAGTPVTPTGDGYKLSVGTNAHGTVKFLVGQNEVTTAAEGETVTVVITPDEGWAVNKPAGKWYAAGSATKAPHRAQNGIDLQQSFELTKLLGQDNTYSFVMDRANAEVSVSYKKLLTHQDITTLDIAAVTYTSEALEPAVTVKDGQTVLVKDTDYTVAYSNNINAAKADATENAPTVTITAVSTSEKFAGEITKTFTINPDTLKEVSLEDTLFMYNFVEPVEQTAVVKEVKSKTLTVPATMYEVVDNSNKGTEPGQYTVTVSGKGNFTGTASTTFTIKNQEVNGDAEKTETGEEVDDVTVTVSVVDRDEQTLNIDNISEGTTGGEGITVEIPAKINGWKVTSISNGAMDGMGNVTDIIMPDTDEPIKVEAGAFPSIATIHTSLALLDDYALMAGLQPNYEATKVVCTVTPVNKYWTLGTGCDVIIPDGIDVYTVQEKNTAEVATEIVPEDQLQYGKERIIKANNGVLLLGTAGQSYDLVAFSGRLASGMPVATTDNKDYGKKNCLEPVVEKKHYDSGHYFVLQNNEFHSILAEGDEVKVPAGKAVLHLGDEQAGATARVLTIDDSTTGVRSVGCASVATDGTFFDLSGRRVAQPTKKGVYIVNGRKVVK